jgi:hypothetical protein
VAGEGTTATGLRFVVVEISVSSGCFDALTVGASWPADATVCNQAD